MKSEWLEGNMENGAVINNRKFQCREKFQWKNRHQRTKKNDGEEKQPRKAMKKWTSSSVSIHEEDSQKNQEAKCVITDVITIKMKTHTRWTTENDITGWNEHKKTGTKKQYQKLPVVIKVVQKKNPCFTLFFKSQHIIISQLDPSMQCKICAFERQIGPAKDTEVNTFVLQ